MTNDDHYLPVTHHRKNSNAHFFEFFEKASLTRVGYPYYEVCSCSNVFAQPFPLATIVLKASIGGSIGTLQTGYYERDDDSALPNNQSILFSCVILPTVVVLVERGSR